MALRRPHVRRVTGASADAQAAPNPRPAPQAPASRIARQRKVDGGKHNTARGRSSAALISASGLSLRGAKASATTPAHRRAALTQSLRTRVAPHRRVFDKRVQIGASQCARFALLNRSIAAPAPAAIGSRCAESLSRQQRKERRARRGILRQSLDFPLMTRAPVPARPRGKARFALGHTQMGALPSANLPAEPGFLVDQPIDERRAETALKRPRAARVGASIVPLCSSP